MKDKRGVDRGACREAGCECTEYEAPLESHLCHYCGHPPTAHARRPPSSAPSAAAAAAPEEAASAAPLYPRIDESPQQQGTPPATAASIASVPQQQQQQRAPLVPAPAASIAPQQQQWPAETLDTICEMLPDVGRERVAEAMRTHRPQGDFDGLVSMLAAEVPAASAAPPAPAAPRDEPLDAETLRAIEEAMVPEFECILCLDEFKVTQMFTVDCESSHRFCFDCIGRYIEMCIKESLPIICPAPNQSCKHELSESEVRQVMAAATNISEDLVKKYQDQLLLRGIRSIPGIVACPSPGCVNWMVPGDLTKRECCHCDSCGANFCSSCKRMMHYNCECEEVLQLTGTWMHWQMEGRARYSRNRAKIDAIKARGKENEEMRQRYETLLADERYKAANGRLCPKCGRIIFKDGGCDIMICGKNYHGGNVQDGCGHHFSWTKAKPYRPAAFREPSKHKQVAIPDDVRDYVHEGRRCDVCHGEVRGVLFECIHCPAFVVCEKCEEEAVRAHPKEHIFRVTFKPGYDETHEVEDPAEKPHTERRWWMIWRW